ncbi:helix-turn-helix domain-containing protein [Nocardia mangyaensis]|uniref:helix-turn-helix domain-containing protein n=1 Tax=Nocardia mangyaensis TaxID=2213200 RepID=UPI000ACA1203|nr:helix-turn-helix domain-containing protein [Nocardia mangyaensis]
MTYSLTSSNRREAQRAAIVLACADGMSIVLTVEEHETLQRWARRAKSSQALAERCRIVLGCAASKSNSDVAAELGITAQTVGKWRTRFAQKRLEWLSDEPRPGRRPSILLDKVEEVLTTTLEQKPVDATDWSRTSMAKRSGLSPSTIGRIWSKFELKPHVADGFKLSTDPLFVDKVVDVVGLYHNPPEKAPRRGCFRHWRSYWIPARQPQNGRQTVTSETCCHRP